MEGLKRLLLFTNSDFGQANVVLATAHELGIACEDVEIHIASFQDLRSGVDDASRFMQTTAAQQKKKTPRPFVFHKIEGTSWGPATKRPETAIFETLELTPGVVNSAKGVAILPAVMIPWSPREFLDMYKETERVFNEVNPDLTIVEPLFTQGLTFCHYRGARWMVLSPNTIKEFAVPVQPKLAALWKYPMQAYIKSDRVRLTDWLVAEPKSVLGSQNIVCSALLPAWTDCYDFANRVELLGIGLWANKEAKPRWQEDELAEALLEILFGPESAGMRKRAEEGASRHPEWEGRQMAAQEILNYLMRLG
uniref:Uncharacterized protein n=1 Tax=Fusarium oxysporum (strain Fo5176) TaxID=660025 RepID=A0A0D2YJ47_FUSOF